MTIIKNIKDVALIIQPFTNIDFNKLSLAQFGPTSI